MANPLKTCEDWLADGEWFGDERAAALVLREPLMPVEGEGAVIFPPTFAAASAGEHGGYNIDPPDGGGGTNVCLVDTVGSQANRIEPLFGKPPCNELVPQIEVTFHDDVPPVSLLEAGHRAGDALVRCTALQQELHDAFLKVLRGNAVPLAKIAPTSLVFGAWDSRDTQAKVPRLVSSTIRAFDVRKLTRSAQFNPAIDYVKQELLEKPANTKARNAYSERGFIHVPATGTHGGVIADGGIRRDATLSLAALRQLSAPAGEDELTLDLRRYILGLSLLAFVYQAPAYLRQGCNLVGIPDDPRTIETVQPDGTRKELKFTPAEALEFAKAAAKKFGVGESRSVPFDQKLAKQDVKKKED